MEAELLYRVKAKTWDCLRPVKNLSSKESKIYFLLGLGNDIAKVTLNLYWYYLWKKWDFVIWVKYWNEIEYG